MRRNKAYPYPEIVTSERGWTVTGTPDNHGGARTDNLNKHMQVPLDRDCKDCGINHSRMIRRHELGHVKWSPKTMGRLKPGVRPEAVEVLEEIRVNYLLHKAGLSLDEPTQCVDKIEITTQKKVYESSIAELILWTLASMWMIDNPESESSYYKSKWGHEFETIKKIIVDAEADPMLTNMRKAELKFTLNTAQQFYQSITKHAYGQKPSYRKVQNYAKKLSEVLDMFLDKPKQEEVYKQETLQHSKEMGEETEEQGEEIENPQTVQDLEQRIRSKLMNEMEYQTTGGVGHWGEMQIHEPALTVNLQGRLKQGRKYRPADFGYNPKFINRWCSDKKIFKQKQHVLGGTILIDASGSMSFSGQDILDIMELLPAVTIAMYNGGGATGDLRIIARNGMRVTEEQLDEWSGRGNVVDGPALHWLATMPERRIWVSDMYIFGAYGDTSGFNLMKDVHDTCIQNKIINLKDIDEVKEHAIKLNIV